MLCRFSVEVTHFVTCFMQFYWAETVMFIKIWQPITLYIDRMDWRAGHLITTEGTGVRGICQQKFPAGPGIWKFFSNARGMPGGLPGEDARDWNWLTHKGSRSVKHTKTEQLCTFLLKFVELHNQRVFPTINKWRITRDWQLIFFVASYIFNRATI